MGTLVTDYKIYDVQLPILHGRLMKDAPLCRLSWFRTGGVADYLFEPESEADLITVLRHLPSDIPVTVLGVGSNLLVRDGGVRGLVIHLGRKFSDIQVSSSVVKAGAGAMDAHVAKAAAKEAVTGLEFLIGVPGTIGGALRMNAGAYGREIADVLLHARAVDRVGHLHELDAADFEYSYRKSGLPESFIFLDASFKVQQGDRTACEERMKEIMAERSESQPIGSRTGGSTFKNPNGHSAWKLIEAAGCRGMRIGGAQVSEKHCNFMINHGDATADDIETLGETVRDKVLAETGVALEWEIRRIGDKA